MPGNGTGGNASNVNVSVRVDSGGANGAVTQANGAAAGNSGDPSAQPGGANVNVSIRAESPGDIGPVSQTNGVGGSGTIDGSASSGAGNVNVSVRVESPGDNGPVNQSNGELPSGGGSLSAAIAPAAVGVADTPSKHHPHAPSDSTQYHEDNSQYHSESDTAKPDWNVVWVLTLDCGDITQSTWDETGNETAPNWVWDWSWNWTCGDSSSSGGSAAGSTAGSGTSSAPSTGTGATTSHASRPGEKTVAPTAAGDGDQGWSWMWAFGICGTQTSLGAPAASAVPTTWTWDWTWNWTCESAADTNADGVAPEAPAGPSAGAVPAMPSPAVPPAPTPGVGIDLSNDSAAASTASTANRTSQDALSTLFGRMPLGGVPLAQTPLARTPLVPPFAEAGQPQTTGFVAPRIAVAIDITLPGVVQVPMPQVTAPTPPDLSSLVDVVPGLDAAPPSNIHAQFPFADAPAGHTDRLAPPAARPQAAPARPDRAAPAGVTTERAPLSTADNASNANGDGRERSEKRGGQTGSRSTQLPRLPLDPPQAPLPSGSSIAWTGGASASVGVVGVATLAGFLVLAAPGLGRRLRPARELSPRSRGRSRIDRPG